MKKYNGSCHCKAVTFTLEVPEITTALQCNCSICRRKNAVMSSEYFSPAQFTLTSDKSSLSVYQWGDKDVNHYFCRNCGIAPFHDVTFNPGFYRVNLGCIDELDFTTLAITMFDGKHAL